MFTGTSGYPFSSVHNFCSERGELTPSGWAVKGKYSCPPVTAELPGRKN